MERPIQRHGGDIVEAAARYGLRPDVFIDFSASINPLGVPESVRRVINQNLHLLAHYPDPACRALRSALSRFTCVPEENIIIGNGGSELIYLAARVLKPRRALILHPTFGGYGEAVLAAGGEVKTVLAAPQSGFQFDLEAVPGLSQMEGVDLIFLCNPNNPTGRTWSRDEVMRLAFRTAPRGIHLVVDEAFMDFVDDWKEKEVIVQAPGHPRLLVLRSMTKFYALAGLRLGYAVAGRELIDRMGAAREPWSVNWLAQMAGAAAIEDREYQSRTRRWIAEEREFLTREMSGISGLESWPTEVNYLLLRIKRENLVTRQLQEILGPRGILIRDGSSFPGLGPRYFRAAIRTRPENQRLVEEVKRALSML